MNEQILYDKQISVTFYQEPKYAEPEFSIHIPYGYEANLISRVRTSGPNWVLGYSPLSNYVPSDSILSPMSFYKGDTRRIFVGYRKDSRGITYSVYKLIQATGSLFRFDTLEEVKKGLRPDGTVFKTGDRVRVKETGEVYSVFVNNGLGSYLKGDTIEEELTTVLYLDSTQEGLKPDMSLSISLLPGQNCYNAVLKIRNLNLADTDIRAWTRMVIVAGYRTGNEASFTCPIFASYIESPNPDGVTVFEGLTVGTAEGIISNKYTEITFLQTKITLNDLVREIAKGIADNIEVNCAIADDIMNTEINVSKQTVYAQNGMAILSWLQTTISQFIQTISEEDPNYSEPISAFVQLNGNELQIMALNGPNKMPEKVQNVISLDMVSGATFNGTALTVTAPWNPVLKPGGLFYMPPEFINGSKLPNVLPEDDYRNPDNLYRALTMSVNFASCEDANRMEILAVPAQWAKEFPEARSTTMRADLLARSLSKQKIENRISIGNTEGITIKEANTPGPKQDDDTEKKMFDDNRDLISVWGAWSIFKIDSSKGNCLSKILEYYFLSDPNGPHLIPDSRGDGTQSSFFKDKDYFKKKEYNDAITHFQSTGCSANVLWWPLVVVGTYWIREEYNKNKVSNNWTKIDTSNPDMIQEGKDLYIPVWSGTWDEQLNKLTMIRNIWKWAYIEYHEKYPSLCNIWRAMYYYLGGPHDNELE